MVVMHHSNLRHHSDSMILNVFSNLNMKPWGRGGGRGWQQIPRLRGRCPCSLSDEAEMFRMFRNPWAALSAVVPETPTVQSLRGTGVRVGRIADPSKGCVNCERQRPLWNCFQRWEAVRRPWSLPRQCLCPVTFPWHHVTSQAGAVPLLGVCKLCNLIPDKYPFLGFSS